MQYRGNPDYEHGSPARTGVLMVNLGTPDSPQTADVRRYLAEFLSDPRIIEIPRWLWWLILHGVILRLRPARSAAAYREVWSEDTGSPLLSISRAQQLALQAELHRRFGTGANSSDDDPGRGTVDDVSADAAKGAGEANAVPVALGMRYGTPSIASAIRELEASDVRRVLVLPMYPQYSGTTTASVFDAVTRELSRTRWIPEMRFINQYCEEPAYIRALADSVRESWEQNGRGELLVTSYHGIPKRYLLNGDPYHCFCHMTTRLLAEELGLPAEKVRVVFQSRVGREEWLRPYCDETMKSLPAEGVRSIDILSPAFSADCLETLEEIAGENRDYFMQAGGERFQYIPCLNDRSDHIASLASLVERHLSGWEIETRYAPSHATDACTGDSTVAGNG